MALPLFAITLFVSAFLLFLVQPMIGKLILPKLGGTPQVWNTCMLFFQTVLLMGYGYTHTVGTRLPTRRQLIVHAVVLALPLLLLPWLFNVTNWTAPTDSNPIPATLLLLVIIVGVPFFVVSTSAPLLQKWFTSTGHPAAKDPYFLYGASNLGSLLALLFYPLAVEPFLTLHQQAVTWEVGYVVLAALVLVCAVVVWQSPLSLQAAGVAPELPAPVPAEAPPVEEPAVQPPAPPEQVSTSVKPGPAPMQGGGRHRKKVKLHAKVAAAPTTPAHVEHRPVRKPREDVMTWGRRIRWIMLAAVPSSLMLGVTTFISTDLSPFPLIWIVPLALYLLSFILVYMRWPVKWVEEDETTFSPHWLMLYIGEPLGILALCFLLLTREFGFLATFIAWIGFFAVALTCHGELARDRPSPRHLTEYFLLMSVGGALGGFFNGIIAPIFFWGVFEFPVAIIAACFVRPTLQEAGWFDNQLMNSFPQLRSWAVEQGDQLSKSMNRPATGSTYVLNYTLDVVMGAFMFGLCWFMTYQGNHGWIFGPEQAAKLLVFLGVSPRNANALYWRMPYRLVIYGIPMLFCFFFSTRPVRFGLAVIALLVVNLIWLGGREDETLYQGRTYFGVLRVLEGTDLLAHRGQQGAEPNDPEEFANFAGPNKDKPQLSYRYSYLMHGTTYHGRNYIHTAGKDAVDLSRLATTYYHRFGPVGIVMEKFNWLPGPQNTYWGDLRMPTTMVGHLAGSLGTGAPMQFSALANVWSEPPFATIGLGTGTMVSYARPYQHMTYYEIDEQIRSFSVPPGGESGFFTYLQGAMRRGVNLEIVMGDARQGMSREESKNSVYPIVKGDQRLEEAFLKQAQNFLIPTASVLAPHEDYHKREKYYKAINVDAFSSDAIPVHLLTLEAVAMYLDKITYEGVLCLHTSNRHLDLVQPAAKIAQVLAQREERFKDLKVKVGKDQDQREKYLGHFSSEYVMLYFDEKYLRPRRDYVPIHNIYDKSVVEWYEPEVRSSFPLWTDDFSNIVSILR